MRRLAAVAVVIPEALSDFLLAHDHVRPREAPSESGESFNGCVRSRFDENRVADQRHARKLSGFIAITIKRAAVESGGQAVVTNEATHHEGSLRSLRQKIERLLSFIVGEGTRGDERSRRQGGRQGRWLGSVGCHISPWEVH